MFSLLGVDLIFHTVAGAFDDDDLRVMKKAVEHGGGEGVVVVEVRGPLLEGFVGGEQDRSAFVASADDLEE